jgi:hypothetical protein
MGRRLNVPFYFKIMPVLKLLLIVAPKDIVLLF